MFGDMKLLGQAHTCHSTEKPKRQSTPPPLTSYRGRRKQLTAVTFRGALMTINKPMTAELVSFIIVRLLRRSGIVTLHVYSGLFAMPVGSYGESDPVMLGCSILPGIENLYFPVDLSRGIT